MSGPTWSDTPRPPGGTDERSTSPGSGTVLSLLPLPHCPYLLKPHAKTRPASVTTAEW